ncbi:MAG: hypothetical protein H0X64_00805 [Gemmatimonadaceae bacterium]|nr:hypothetical protein [Gemmatimonadaceae bacterium]
MSSRTTLIHCLAVAAFVTAAASQQGGAQVTPQVPLDARTYDRVDALIAEGIVRTAIVGQRPYSRREIARIAAEASSRLDDTSVVGRSDRPRIARIIESISVGPGDLQLAPVGGAISGVTARGVTARIDGLALTVTELDSPARPVGDVGLGTIDAVINPLAELRSGRRLSLRSTVASEAAASGELGSHVAFAAHIVAGPTGDEPVRSYPGTPRVHSLSLTAGVNNIVLQVGRQPVLYGQGITGGPFTTRNAPALDMVRVGNDVPATLPSFLRLLGPASGSIFLADLGPRQNFPHARLAGWKMSFRPRPWLEVGASLLSQQGGQGGPEAKFHERVVDVLTIIDVLVLQDRDLLISNKLAGVDLRLTLPGVELYYDGMLDDFDARRIVSSLWEENGFVTGITLPGLGPNGAFRIDAEYQHTGLRYYQHGQFLSGVTFNGAILGLPLGPRGEAGLGRLRWDPAGRASATVTAALERRSGDVYVITTSGPNDAGWQFVKTVDNPEERRARLVAGLVVDRVVGRARLQAEAGIERVANAGFAAGRSRTNKLGQLSLVLGFW